MFHVCLHNNSDSSGPLEKTKTKKKVKKKIIALIKSYDLYKILYILNLFSMCLKCVNYYTSFLFYI